MLRTNELQIEFWLKAWEQSRGSEQQRPVAEKGGDWPVSRWNRRAASYARNSSSQTYQAMQQTVLQFLEFSGVKLEGAEILDLGCGPGNYTLPLAQRAAHVWALDPAEMMLDLVRDRADRAGLKNIRYVHRAWEDIDLEKEGWSGKFDLVFASMTPGVSDKATLDKMIASSRGYCYLSRFSGKRRNSLEEKLWPLLAQKYDLWPNPGMDVIYPFNLLYAMGYFPSLKFIRSNWVHEEDIARTSEKLLVWLDGYLDVTGEMESTVREFVTQEAVAGIVREEGEANMGLMVWRV